MSLPQPERVRRRFPARLMVLTETTFTSKTFSTAILISVLFALVETRNVYLFSSSSA